MTRRGAAATVLLSVAFLLGDCQQADPADSKDAVRQGDRCSVDGATGHTNRGKRLVCSRHRGLDYLTWDVG